MPEDRDATAEPTAVERLVARSLEDTEPSGALSERARHTRRSVESYLRAGVRPRWMTRLREIERGIAVERRRLELAYRTLRTECGDDEAAFGMRWRAVAESWRFDEVNLLITQHNDWYPIERDLPMDPRTCDYVLIAGRSYRRALLGADWVLEQFPAAAR